MNRQKRDVLDSHITGHGGEDQFLNELESIPQPFVNLVRLKRGPGEWIYLNPAQVTWVTERDIGCDIRMIDNTIVMVQGTVTEVVMTLRGEL